LAKMQRSPLTHLSAVEAVEAPPAAGARFRSPCPRAQLAAVACLAVTAAHIFIRAPSANPSLTLRASLPVTRACVAYIFVSPSLRDFDNLKKSMASVEQHFSARAGYPFVILTDDVEAVRHVTEWTSLPVLFQHVTFSFRRGFDDVRAPAVWRIPEWTTHPGWNMAYRQMSRYAAWPLFQESVFDNFDYIVKMDADAFFTGPPDGERDPVAEMRTNGQQFAFWIMMQDVPMVTVGLGEAIADLLREEKALLRTPSIIKDATGEYRRTNIYGCFWIARLEFFRSPAYERLFHFFDSRDGWFFHRWDEQKLYALAASMYWLPADLLHMDFVHVQHQGMTMPAACCLAT
jgi:hypothetical protein